MRKAQIFAAAAAALALAPLAGCSDGGETSGTATAAASASQGANGTLAAAMGAAPGLTTLSSALSGAGLGDVFDGPGSYTVLAPDDDAFAKLGGDGKTLTDPAHRAELVAILRGHILPGHLTPEAIKQAITEKNGPVSMRNLADGTVTFSIDGDTIVATGDDGAKATVDGKALVASNGVVLPLDGLVKSAQPAKVS